MRERLLQARDLGSSVQVNAVPNLRRGYVQHAQLVEAPLCAVRTCTDAQVVPAAAVAHALELCFACDAVSAVLQNEAASSQHRLGYRTNVYMKSP